MTMFVVEVRWEKFPSAWGGDVSRCIAPFQDAKRMAAALQVAGWSQSVVMDLHGSIVWPEPVRKPVSKKIGWFGRIIGRNE